MCVSHRGLILFVRTRLVVVAAQLAVQYHACPPGPAGGGLNSKGLRPQGVRSRHPVVVRRVAAVPLKLLPLQSLRRTRHDERDASQAERPSDPGCERLKAERRQTAQG